MASKRLRVFAGPNGSGKTTIINSLRSEIGFGIYVNADDIEANLKESKVLLFNSYNLKVTENQIHTFFRDSQFAPVLRNENDLWEMLHLKDNVLHVNTYIDSYLAADLAEFIRQQLLENDISFTYETVMSHVSKLNFLNKAREKDFRIYLYYVATEDPEINISRVNVRVALNGHDVNSDRIRNRYFKSLKQLKPAIKLSHRAYIWDNSSSASILIAEITDGEDVKIFDTSKVPNWFVKYLINS